MLANEGISRLFFMIKRSVFPADIVMAGATFFGGPFSRKKVYVIFLVTRLTGGAQTEKVSLALTRLFVAAFICMTLGTGDLRVGTVQDKTGLGMVEFFLIDLRRIMTAPLMIAVASDTSALCKPMKRIFFLNRLLNRRVTNKAFAIRDTLTRIMALEAISVLEIFVTSHERSGCQELIDDTFA